MYKVRKLLSEKKGKSILVVTATLLIILIVTIVRLPEYKGKDGKVTLKENGQETEKEKNQINLETKEVNDELKIPMPTEDSLNIENIPGFSNEITLDNQVAETTGIKLPYIVPNTPMEINSIGKYQGPFVEDGSNANIDNALAIIVKNNSDEMLQYGEIKLKINDESEALFKISNLPSKTSVLVIESTGKIEFNKENTYAYVDSLYASMEEVTLFKDKLNITKDDNKLKVKNVSHEDLGTVYIYYKYVQEGGVYLGGITFRSKFENMAQGKELEVKSGHFSKDASAILMVEST